MRKLKYTEAEVAAVQLEEWAGVGKKKPTRKRGPDPAKARRELAEMMLSGKYDSATPMHFVALYEWCHERIYGVPLAELAKRAAWSGPVFAAARMLKDDFTGDPTKMVDYVRWAWKREAGREAMRRAGRNANVGRLGWRLLFGPYVLTDYRIEVARGNA